MASNPINSNRLRLDEEVREIKEGLLCSKYRDNFTFSQSWAVRLRDLRRSMLDYDPHIVHFCGHGAESGLLVENDSGEATVVEANALEGLFELFKKQVDCVLLNACYSHRQALAINKHINCVMGMKSGIQDKAAIEFAIGFYDALGAGRTFKDAFKFGQNAIQLFKIPQNLTPVLSLRSSQSQNVLGTEIDVSSNQDHCKKKILERLLTTRFLNIGSDQCQTFQSKEYVGKSGNKYLIDASFEIDAGGINLVILAQCNINLTPVTSDNVMSLSYKLRDIGAHKGLLITSWGFDNNAV